MKYSDVKPDPIYHLFLNLPVDILSQNVYDKTIDCGKKVIICFMKCLGWIFWKYVDLTLFQ